MIVMTTKEARLVVRNKVICINGKIPVAIGRLPQNSVLLFRIPNKNHEPMPHWFGCTEYGTFDPDDAE